ncbi:hypothetical protein EON67_00145 [archaeon]|nr:MAG: hypothetical protein EON67_00145 [archaeon]
MTSLAPRRTGDDAPATVAAPAPAAGVGSDAVSAHTKHGHDTSISFWTALTTYTAYTVLMIFGKLRDFLGRLTGCSRYFNSASRTRAGYAPLSADWENFFTRRMYHRVQDCFNRPIAGPPTAANLKVVIRESNDGNYTLRYVACVRE